MKCNDLFELDTYLKLNNISKNYVNYYKMLEDDSFPKFLFLTNWTHKFMLLMERVIECNTWDCTDEIGSKCKGEAQKMGIFLF